jgi:hypothetical protein
MVSGVPALDAAVCWPVATAPEYIGAMYTLLTSRFLGDQTLADTMVLDNKYHITTSSKNLCLWHTYS